MDVLHILRPVLSIEHGVGPEDVLLDLAGLDHCPHLFDLVILFLAVGELILEEAVDTSHCFFSRVDGRLEGALLHLILFDFLLELLKLLLAVQLVIIARLPLIVVVLSIEPQLLVQDLLVLVLHLVERVVLGGVFLERIWVAWAVLGGWLG